MLLATTTPEVPLATQSMLDVHVELPVLQLDTAEDDTLFTTSPGNDGKGHLTLMKDFAEFNSSIKYSAFRSGIQEWCARVRQADLQRQGVALRTQVSVQTSRVRALQYELTQVRAELQQCEASIERVAAAKRKRT